jgi:6-phosphogluconate dehydrogenase
MQLGVIGLGTMGANIARNAARNGAAVSLFNRTTEKTEEFHQKYGAEGNFVVTRTLEELVQSLTAPRTILLMVKAGAAVDDLIKELLPLLQTGDILIDGGNSHYHDTEKREKALKRRGIHFIGMGISGGEEGALNGPSMMPGGNKDAYALIEPLFSKMAAKDMEGGACFTYMGPGGAGHFVKMVHNGIEYGLMQLLAESYDIVKNVGNMSNDELSPMYTEWNQGLFQSFLLDITVEVTKKKDPETGEFLLDVIKDAAGQKGTGKWTTEAAMNVGVSIPTITAAVDARILSSDPMSRKQRSPLYPQVLPEPYPEMNPISVMAKSAYELSALCTYAQGFELLRVASKEYKWNLNLSEISRIWEGGCIIRANLLENARKEFLKEQDVQWPLFLTEHFNGEIQEDWRRIVAIAMGQGLPVPSTAASLSYYDTLRRIRLPQNLVQAQRDFFGAHTYERTDREGTFHTDWSQSA